jgi:hypothetical protein
MLSLTMNASSAWQKQGYVKLFFKTVKGFAFSQNTLQKQGRVKCEERAQRVHTIQNHKS